MIVPYHAVVTVQAKQRYVTRFEGDSLCLVKVHDAVVPSTVVLEGRSSEVLQSINICRELGIAQKDAAQYILKTDGEIVETGDVIAHRTVAMGTVERIVKTRHDGRISTARLDAGIIDVCAPYVPSSVTAGVHGKIRRILPEQHGSRQIEIETTGYVAHAIVSKGADAAGELVLLKNGDSVYRASDVDGRCRGKIVVAGRSLSLGLYESLVEAGARGLVVGGMPMTEFRLLEHVPIPFLVTEGWGIIPINSVLMSVLRECEGSMVCVDSVPGTILVCPDPIQQSGESVAHDESDGMAELHSGQTVQIWDMPYWGYCGTVVQMMEDEELIQVLLPSGKKVVVPQGVVVAVGEGE